MAELLAVLGYALFCKIMDEAGVHHNIGPVCANLLTIPIGSDTNQLPSGVIGDAFNYERKTHNEAKAQKEMRENDARQRREDERIERENNEVRAYVAERKLAEKKEREEDYLKYKKNIQGGRGLVCEKKYVELYELEVLYDSDKIGLLKYSEQKKNILDKYRNEIADEHVKLDMRCNILGTKMSEGKITGDVYTKSTQLLEKGNYLQFKKNIKDGKGRKYEEQFVELYELEVLRDANKIGGMKYYDQKQKIYDKYENANETFGQYIKIEAPHALTASLKITTTPSLPKTTQSINTYMKISTEAYSQYNAGNMTASEYLTVQNAAREVYEKYGHLTSNQVYFKISEDASKQYKAGKMKQAEFVKICNDARTKYYTEPVKPSTQVPIQPNSTLNNIESGAPAPVVVNRPPAPVVNRSAPTPAPVVNRPSAPAPVPQPRVENGHVISAQARVNAVNQVASVVSSGATAVGNAYIQGANNIGNYNRMEAQATQQLVSNVASTVGNGATAVANGFVNPSANSERTNQVLNMVSNAPSAVDLYLSNPRGIGINIATGMLAEVNNSYNERSTTRNMVNGTIGAVGLVAGVVGAPTIATTIGGTMLAVEGAELVNNMHNTIIERAPTEVRANMLSDSW